MIALIVTIMMKKYFYQPDTLTPEKAKQIVKNYFELPDDAVTYMPEYNFGADKTYQYAFLFVLDYL